MPTLIPPPTIRTWVVNIFRGGFSEFWCKKMDYSQSTDNRGPQIVAVTVALLVLSIVAVGLRCFVRASLTKSFQADDWLMVLALVSSTVESVRYALQHLTTAQALFILSSAFILVGVHYGVGRHNASLSPNNATLALKVRTSTQMLLCDQSPYNQNSIRHFSRSSTLPMHSSSSFQSACFFFVLPCKLSTSIYCTFPWLSSSSGPPAFSCSTYFSAHLLLHNGILACFRGMEEPATVLQVL